MPPLHHKIAALEKKLADATRDLNALKEAAQAVLVERPGSSSQPTTFELATVRLSEVLENLTKSQDGP